jgi:hypothetical protein
MLTVDNLIRRLNGLYVEVRQLVEKRDWPEVIDTADQIWRLEQEVFRLEVSARDEAADRERRLRRVE